ncbi:MAG TPA: hypothetical protein VK675_04070 [Candidatus Paceibacterota bacterium]|nr:hypothetical protein [Candidatus Paceibacterota bacterium]
MSKFITFIFILLMLITPVFSSAQTNTSQGLVPCGKVTPSATTVNGVAYKAGEVVQCGFNDLMTLINTVIKFILFDLVVPIAAIMFFYAGFELVTSGGSTEKRGVAKKVFTNAAIGLVIAAAAWLIVKTILSILGYKDIGTFF